MGQQLLQGGKIDIAVFAKRGYNGYTCSRKCLLAHDTAIFIDGLERFLFPESHFTEFLHAVFNPLFGCELLQVFDHGDQV